MKGAGERKGENRGDKGYTRCTGNRMEGGRGDATCQFGGQHRGHWEKKRSDFGFLFSYQL